MALKTQITMTTTTTNNIIVSAQYILGFVDAEGMFAVTVQRGGGPTGHKFSLEFKVTQKAHSIAVLEAIKAFFGCGRIGIDNRKDDTLKYTVTDIHSIVTIIIPFFLANTLLTSKYLNFMDFYKVSKIIALGQHLTLEGAQRILDIASGMNSKRSWMDKYQFMLTHSLNVTAGWLQGFIDGDGSFTTWLGLSSSTRNTQHTVLQLFLEIKQNTHDVFLLQAIILYLGVGNIKPKFDLNNTTDILSKRSTAVLIVRETQKVIDFVDSNPMLTRKRLDYEDWKRLHGLKTKGVHLTPEGKLQIELIRSQMNSKRS